MSDEAMLTCIIHNDTDNNYSNSLPPIPEWEITNIGTILGYPTHSVTLLPSLLHHNCIYAIGGFEIEDESEKGKFASNFCPMIHLFNLETKSVLNTFYDFPGVRQQRMMGLVNTKRNELCIIGCIDKCIAVLNEPKVKQEFTEFREFEKAEWTIIPFEQKEFKEREEFGEFKEAEKVGSVIDAVFDDEGDLHLLLEKPDGITGGYHKVYNFDRGQWINKADLPSKASCKGGFINLNNGKNELYYFSSELKTSFIYYCNQDRWIPSVDLPCLFKQFTYVNILEQVIVFGNRKEIYMFDTGSFEWVKVEYELPGEYGVYYGCSSTPINDNRILVMAGENDGQPAKNFILTIPATTKATTKTTATSIAMADSINKNCDCRECDCRLCCESCDGICKRIKKWKGIYVSVIIHLGDVVTDYLVLIQYGYYWYDEYSGNNNYPKIDYFYVLLFSVATILVNKILSSWYIWQFTQNIFDVVLNCFDFYILKEILASHKTGNKTDLLLFLQKIEKICESFPQMALQSYVLLRSDSFDEINSSNNSVFLVTIQILSVLMSFYAISDKLITDDKFVFIKASGANKSWKKSKWYYRILFRLCEVIANLSTITIICVFYGVYLSLIYVFYLLIINFILFRNGLLGRNMSNIFIYLVAVINLGVTPTHSTNEQAMCMSKTFKCCIECLFKRSFCFCKKIVNIDEYDRQLSFYLVTTRIISGLWLIVITTILYYCTYDVTYFDELNIIPDRDTRFVNKNVMNVLLWFVILSYVLEFLFYILIFDGMNLGVSLERDITTYIVNYKFSDAIRMQKINKKERKSDIEIMENILKMIVEYDVSLLLVQKPQRKIKLKSETMTEEQGNEHLYLINEINKLVQTHHDDSQRILCDILSNAVFNCHLSMIEFIIANKWIDNICKQKFGIPKATEEEKTKNILSLIIENCSHRSDILKSIVTKYDDCFDNQFDQLLMDKTNKKKRNVIHELISNISNTPEIMKHLSNKYYDVFVECKVIRYIFKRNMSWFEHCLQFPTFPDDFVDTFSLTGFRMTSIRAKMLESLLSDYYWPKEAILQLLSKQYGYDPHPGDDTENKEDDVKTFEENINNQIDSKSELNMKQIFETMVYDSFKQQNYVLFDILIDLWKNNWQQEHGIINLFKFGTNNKNNFLEMIYDKLGNSDEQKLSIVFGIFAKHQDYFNNNNNNLKEVNKLIWYLFWKSIQEHRYSFARKLAQIEFVTGEGSWSSAFHEFGEFHYLIDSVKTPDHFKMVVSILDTFWNVNKQGLKKMTDNGSSISCFTANDIVDHPNAVEWIEWFIKNGFKLCEYDVYRILAHPRMIEIIEILNDETLISSQDDEFDSFIYEYSRKGLKCNNKWLMLLICGVDRDNLYFVQHLFKMFKGSRMQRILNGTKDMKHYENGKYVKIEGGLEMSIKSSKMIDILVKNGWIVPQLKNLLQIEQVSPVLVKYIIKRQNIKISLKHLKLRIQHFHDYYFDVMHILLSVCDEQVRQEFYENRLTYCNYGNQKVIHHLQLLLGYTFDMPPTIREDKLNDDPYKAYFYGKRENPKLWQTKMGASLLKDLILYYLEIDDKHDPKIIESLIAKYSSSVAKHAQDILTPTIIEAAISHNNFDAMKQIVDGSGRFLDDKNIYAFYTLAKGCEYHKMTDYLKQYIGRTTPTVNDLRSKYDWSRFIDINNSNSNNLGMQLDVSTNVRTENTVSMSTNYHVSLNDIKNSLLKLYDVYINDIDNDLKNEFIKNVYCNEKYFCNIGFEYELRSGDNQLLVSTQESGGIQLFHAIASNVNAKNILKDIIEQINDDRSLLLVDYHGNTVFEYIVFGRYNAEYQRLKFDSTEKENEKYENKQFIDLLHQIQRRTLSMKLKCIV